jgi:hypothetical protein
VNKSGRVFETENFYRFRSRNPILRKYRSLLVEKGEKVLVYLRDNGGSAKRSVISIEVFSRNCSSSELDELLETLLSGFVTVDRSKKWLLTPLGWSKANAIQIVAPEAPESQQSISSDDGWTRFKELAKANPDASQQRLLQLAGRHIGDPLDPQWAEWRASHPEWFLQQPKDWYAPDVELTEDYPTRYPSDPLTAKDREVRPTGEAGWFERAMRHPGASLEPLACEMPAIEVANVIRVCRKIGMPNAVDIFGAAKIATAHRLVGVKTG